MDEDFDIDTREGVEDEDWQRRLFQVKESLNRYNMTRSKALDAGPLIALVDIVDECELGIPNAYQRLVTLAVQNNGFRGTSQQTINFFKSLKHPNLDGAVNIASIAFSNLVSQHGPLLVTEHWDVAETLQRLYNLSRIQIYCSIINEYATREPVDLDGKIALIEYIRWCITPDVAEKLLNPRDPGTELIVDTWSDYSLAAMRPILPIIVFRASIALMPFNMTAESSYRGDTVSLQDILGDPTNVWSLEQRYVAHVLYPNIFTPSAPPADTYEMSTAVLIAVKCEATVAQIQQICPFLSSLEMQSLMADIVRIGLNNKRLDVAQAYGFGPNTLKFIDMDQSRPSNNSLIYQTWPESRFQSWRIYDFLKDAKIPPRTILETMQLPQDRINQILANYDVAMR